MALVEDNGKAVRITIPEIIGSSFGLVTRDAVVCTDLGGTSPVGV